MADQLQLRGGSTAEHSTFTGALREVTVDIDKDTVVVHDNATAGGHPLLREDLSNLPAGTIDNADINANAEIAVSKLADGAARQLLQTDSAGTGVEWTNNVDVPGTLDVTGAATLDSTLDVTGLISADGKVSFPLGTAALPSLYPGTDTNTGIYSPGADQVAVATNGVGRLFVDASGNVGVGGAPSRRFHVIDSGDTYLAIQGGTASKAGIFFGDSDNHTLSRIRHDNADNSLQFMTSETERLRITSDGKVGVGTSDPGSYESFGSQLVVANTSSNAGITIASSSSGIGTLLFADGTATSAERQACKVIYDHSTNQLSIGPQGSLVVRIDNAANRVGIGTTAPAGTLGVDGFAYFGNQSASGTTDGVLRIGESTSSMYIQTGTNTSTGSSADLVFSNINAANEWMRLTSAGRLGLGTSSPQADLEVSRNVNGVGSLVRLQNTSTTNSTRGTSLRFSLHNGTAQADAAFITGLKNDNTVDGATSGGYLTFGTANASWDAPTERMRIDSSGNVGIGTTDPDGLLHLAGSAASLYFEDTASSNTLSRIYKAGSALTINSRHTTAGQIVFNSENSAGVVAERARIDSSGRLLVGTSTARTNYNNLPATVAPSFQVEGKGSGRTISITSCDSSNNAGGGVILAHQNSGAVGGNTAVSNNDVVGRISFQGSDGSEFVLAADIRGEVDGTPGANDMPGRLVFSTTADGASSPTERMRIGQDGASRFFSSANTTTVRAGNASGSGTSHRLFYGLHSATNVTNGTAIYSIFTNGTVGTPSDIRLKKNVESTRDGYLDDVANLRVVKYHWKTQDDSEPKELGLIAQEVEQIFPGLIRTEGEGENETKELKRSVIPFILLKALQEANEKIEAQQQIIEDLLARVTALEAQ